MCGRTRVLYSIWRVYLSTNCRNRFITPSFCAILLPRTSICLFHFKFLSYQIPRYLNSVTVSSISQLSSTSKLSILFVFCGEPESITFDLDTFKVSLCRYIQSATPTSSWLSVFSISFLCFALCRHYVWSCYIRTCWKTIIYNMLNWYRYMYKIFLEKNFWTFLILQI